jgi:hypothetical protein
MLFLVPYPEWFISIFVIVGIVPERFETGPVSEDLQKSLLQTYVRKAFSFCSVVTLFPLKKGM